MPPLAHRPTALAWQVFRGSDAVRRGLLTVHQLRSSAWVQLRHDVYADARLDRDHGLACRAVGLRLPPDAMVAGPSAAYLHGVEHAAGFTDDVHVLAPVGTGLRSRRGLRVHTTLQPLRVATVPASGTYSPIAPPTARAGRPAVPATAVTRAGPAHAAAAARPIRRSAEPSADSLDPRSHAGDDPVRLSTDGDASCRSIGDGTVPSRVGPTPSSVALPAPSGVPPRTGPAHAAWETAAWLEPVRAVGIVDSLLGQGLTTRAELAEVAGRCATRPGGSRAQRVFDLADPGAQSPPESHLRVRLVLAGLPRPVTQLPVHLPSGLILHPDLAWPEFRVAVEYDGAWHADPDQLHRDRRRLNQFAGAGWFVLHVTGRRLREDFPAVVREVRAALSERGWRR
ncbi:hypothetical protein E1193_21420 [Micromonospora sp. KC606]|uniref:endonuclease domain-containing protein n=1 Tax=Micromonospora sp. KC606 TaxID=2530379 RepID=UPI0010450054|nr:hypothetical protein [Micromonospora sp. KC606]TDC78058.1 hypothetical protein E1193_21420 [Micromonospora sp. KC606]